MSPLKSYSSNIVKKGYEIIASFLPPQKLYNH